jgi:alpha-tubulin suppressor-like RCC1 family protein
LIQKHNIIGSASLSIRDLDLKLGSKQSLEVKLQNGQGVLQIDITPIDFGKIRESSSVPRKGQLFSWGVHTSGQLGTGYTDSDYVYVSEPQRVPFFKDLSLVSVAAGYWSSFGITTDKKVYAWGRNTNHQLGLEDTELEYDIPYKIGFFEDMNMKQIAPVMNKNFTAFLTEDGNVFVTGMMGTELFFPPKQITELSDKNIVQISTSCSRSGDASFIYARSGMFLFSFNNNSS